MKKEEIVLLARELFKIRIMSSREGLSQDDGKHKLTVGGITAYNHITVEKWYEESIKIATIISAAENAYLNKEK
jgi:hypothetical protein